MARKTIYIFILLFVIMLFGCAMFQTPTTPVKRYYTALKFFNDNLTDYLAAYTIAPPATQAKWKAEIQPIIERANTALDLWGGALGSQDREAYWLAVKRELIAALLVGNIIEIRED